MSRKFKQGDIVIIRAELIGIKKSYAIVIAQSIETAQYINVVCLNNNIWPALREELELVEDPSALIKEFLK